MGYKVYVRNKKTLPHQGGHWSEKKQLEVVTTYLATGNLSETSRICNVPRETLKKWKQTDWWDNLITEIQSGEGQRVDNKMSKIIDKALDALVTRIDEGDYQFDQKTGRLVKVPLKARDLERVTAGLFDKRQLIRKQPTNIKAADLNQTERLLQLAEQFAKFAGQKVPEERVINEHIEGEFIDYGMQEKLSQENISSEEEITHAIHDQREAQLQEGIGMGTQEEEESREG